jgi:serine/threonine-protein kinase RsbW
MSSMAQPLPHTVIIASNLVAAREVEEQILKETERMGFSKECGFAIRLALEEAIVNAHRHGNQSDTSKTLTISYNVDHDRMVVRIRDEGTGFDPEGIPDPTQPDRICLPNGRGLMLMRAYLDELHFNDKGNEVTLIKERC